MSLKPFSACVVPERTASVARAAFPNGSLCIRIFDELGTIFQDQDFADLYSQHGQPGQPPFRLALVTVLQFIEGLSDRGAADAVRWRIDWKYLLCLEGIGQFCILRAVNRFTDTENPPVSTSITI